MKDAVKVSAFDCKHFLMARVQDSEGHDQLLAIKCKREVQKLRIFGSYGAMLDKN